MQGNYTEAIKNWEPALEFYEQAGDEQLVANMLSNLGSAYYTTGKNVEAIEYSLRALKVAEELGDSVRIGTLLNTIGLVYSEQPSTLDAARNYYLRTLEIAGAIGYEALVGVSYINLGELYMEKESYDSALFYFEKSLTVLTSNIDISATLAFIGNIYSQREDYAKATRYYQDALELAIKEDAKREMVGSLLGMASVNESQNNPRKAIEFYTRAESIAEEIGLNNELSGIYEGLASSYAEISDFPNAYRYLSLQNDIDNTIYRIDSEKRANNLIFSYQMEKKQDEIAILEQQSVIDNLKSKRQRAIIITTGLFGLLLLAMAVGLFNRMQFIRRTNEKINAQNVLITDSISYAQRIQSAILPSRALLNQLSSSTTVASSIFETQNRRLPSVIPACAAAPLATGGPASTRGGLNPAPIRAALRTISSACLEHMALPPRSPAGRPRSGRPGRCSASLCCPITRTSAGTPESTLLSLPGVAALICVLATELSGRHQFCPRDHLQLVDALPPSSR